MNKFMQTNDRLENLKTAATEIGLPVITAAQNLEEQTFTQNDNPACCVPPKLLTRNRYGLLESVNYVFNEDGSINWRKMIKPEYMAVQEQYKATIEQKAQKPLAEIPIHEIDDAYLLILLAGIKELANIRGFTSVKYQVIPASENLVLARCVISWIGNYETNYLPIEFEDGADASIYNTTGFGKQYLTATAINRAFVRSVRNFLKIHIVAKEELAHTESASPQEEKQNIAPLGVLEKAMKEKNVSFEEVLELARKRYKKDTIEWQSPADVPKGKIMTLLGLINSIATNK